MRIGQLANIVGVTTATIRFYEQKGLMTSAKRSSNGYRYYDDNDIQRLQLIKFSQGLGFSLDELPKMFSAETLDHESILLKLKEKQEELALMLEQLSEKKLKMDKLVHLIETTWQGGECLPSEALAEFS